RFIGSALLQKLRSGTVLGAAAVASFILVITSVLSTGHFAMWSIILVGLFNSVMFPNIFTLGIAGLGPLTGKGSGILVMSIVGGAILPVLMGALADGSGCITLSCCPRFVISILCITGGEDQGRGFRHSSVRPTREEPRECPSPIS